MNRFEKVVNFFAREKNFVSVHTLIIFVTMWMTWEAFQWAAEFAFSSEKEGSEIALIIGAVIVPITALQGFSFANYRWYRENR